MAKDYDKILTRLIGILSKLSNDERYNTKELAIEYGVSVRSIQKDIKERLINFPIVKDNDGKFIFEYGFTLNKSLLTSDEMMLVSLALSQFEEVSDFNKLTSSALKKLLNPTNFNPYYVKQDDLENIDIDSQMIGELEEAIKLQNHILIQGVRGDIEVEPYKIVAYDGIWYLVAKDEVDQKTKTFMIHRIQKIKTLQNKHKVSQKQVEELLDKTHSAWFEEGNCYEVTIKVFQNIAHLFLQRDFLQSQEILEELEDGSLIVSFDISHDEDIDNIIKAWLPDIEVIAPIRYRDKLKKELEDYLKRIS